MKKSNNALRMLAGSLFLLGGAASAATYFAIVPLPGKLNVPSISVALTSSTLPDARLWKSYSYSFKDLLAVENDKNFDPDQAVFTSPSALPNGMTLREDGTLYGTPTELNELGNDIQVVATYKTKAGRQGYTLRVNDSLINVTLAQTALPPGNLFEPYAFSLRSQLSVSGDEAFDAGRVVFKAEGALPVGLSLNADGTLTGIPTEKDLVGSQVQVVALYKDKQGGQVYTLRINGSLINVTLASATLPTGVNGTPYSYNLAPLLSITGGRGDAAVATWSTTSDLPAGISLSADGKLSGTPTSMAKPGLPVKIVADYKDKSGQQTYTLTIDGKPFNAAKISIGEQHTCAITAAGAAYCWGTGTSGQLGDGLSKNANNPVPVEGLSSNVTAIAAGSKHTCAIQLGAVKCWGYNAFSQLGDGTATNRAVPVAVSGLAGTATAIAVGQYHTCAIAGSAVKCWGLNNYGQLGNSTYVQAATPVAATGMTAVSQIAAGQSHTCALTTSGGMKCWGYNNSGELGNNTRNFNNVPGWVYGRSSGVSAIAAGGEHSCLIASGAVYCWGERTYGQAVVGQQSQMVPLSVAGMTSGTTSISASLNGACAIQSGALKCWGSGVWGKLGTATGASTVTGTPVVGLATGVTAFSTGTYTSCAVQSGLAKCWGNNVHGNLGTGTSSEATPAQVMN